MFNKLRAIFRTKDAETKKGFLRLVNHAENHPEIVDDIVLSLARSLQMQRIIYPLMVEDGETPACPFSILARAAAASFGYRNEVLPCRTIQGEREKVSLTDVPVLTFPWTAGRWLACFNFIGVSKGKPWKEDEVNHMCERLKGLDIYHMVNGYHSTCVGILKHEGDVTVIQEIDVTTIFPHIHSDGVHYIRTETGKRIGRAYCFEFAAIYEIKRRAFMALT